MMSPEEAYKYDSTFRQAVDQMRALLGYYEITPAELRQAAMLASTMHEAERIRPLLIKYDKNVALFPSMFGGDSGRFPSDKPNPPSNGPYCICGAKGPDYKHSATCKHYNWKPTPFTEHVFGKVQGIKDYEFRVCKRCGLSDIYIGDSKDACKGTIKLR